MVGVCERERESLYVSVYFECCLLALTVFGCCPLVLTVFECCPLVLTVFQKGDNEQGKYEKERIAQAQRIMRPFVLRRLKKDVSGCL